MLTRPSLQLKVIQIRETCSFELSWGEGQKLLAQLVYPESLASRYENWQEDYRSYYNSFQRGRVIKPATVEYHSPEYWHKRVSKTEAYLLSEFHQWLREKELYEIRAQIAHSARHAIHHGQAGVDVFLTCSPDELVRLPWETWEIDPGLVEPGTFRIARTPANIRHEPVQVRRKQTRILAIVGHDGTLDFQADLTAVQKTLKGMAEVQYVICHPAQAPDRLRQQICDAIADERGWDILFFSGHSNEDAVMGGELSIVPGVFLNMRSLEPSLKQAKARGLQFALFNSCNGLDIADFLINLGFNQVAIMREPIHNEVAQEFLVRFLQSLAQSRDVHDCLLSACQHLQLEKHLTYPSSYLVPSLFRYPDVVPFHLKPNSLKQRLKQWLPTMPEAIVLAVLLLFSSVAPVQEVLLNSRTFVQAIYRDRTNQFPKSTPPPVLLVSIDLESINQAKAQADTFDILPMDRRYLAQVISQVAKLNVRAIGVDYILDLPRSQAQKLSQSVQTAIQDRGTWFIFATSDLELEKGIVNPQQSLQGDISFFGWDIRLPDDPTCAEACPFAYLLALSCILERDITPFSLAQSVSEKKQTFQQNLNRYLQQPEGRNTTETFFKQIDPRFGLPTIIDFSIPPQQAYRIVPAWKILSSEVPAYPQQQVAIVASGGYKEAEDNFPMPPAIHYWCQAHKESGLQKKACPLYFTGGEAHAYMVHHFLSGHRIVVIPDALLVIIAALLGKWLSLILSGQNSRRRKKWITLLGTATATYVAAGLQLYIWASVLLPSFLPSVMLWTCVLFTPTTKRRKTYV